MLPDISCDCTEQTASLVVSNCDYRRPVMRTSAFITRSGAAAVLLGVWILPSSASAQQLNDSRPSPPPQVYNPYPPGLLPDDLESEIAMVVLEVDFIFD